jgi:hypothetical protein
MNPLLRADARTCSGDGSKKPDCPGRTGITNFLENDGTSALWKPLSESPGTPTAGPQSFMTAVDRRFCSRIWRGFAIKAEELLHAATKTKPTLYQL